MIDLSSIEPDSLGPLHLEEIPLCSFSEKGRPYKPKAKKSKKKWKDDEHRNKKTKGESSLEGDKKAGKKVYTLTTCSSIVAMHKPKVTVTAETSLSVCTCTACPFSHTIIMYLRQQHTVNCTTLPMYICIIFCSMI